MTIFLSPQQRQQIESIYTQRVSDVSRVRWYWSLESMAWPVDFKTLVATSRMSTGQSQTNIQVCRIVMRDDVLAADVGVDVRLDIINGSICCEITTILRAWQIKPVGHLNSENLGQYPMRFLWTGDGEKFISGSQVGSVPASCGNVNRTISLLRGRHASTLRNGWLRGKVVWVDPSHRDHMIRRHKYSVSPKSLH